MSDIEIYGCPYCAQHHLHDPYDCETTHTDDTRWLIRKDCEAMTDQQISVAAFGGVA